MKMAMLSAILFTAMLGIPLSAAAEQASTPAARPVGDTEMMSALAAELRQQREVRLAMASIRSRAQLDEYLARTPPAASPIARLSTGARKRFVRSLTFNERGITGFEYDDLEMELSATEAYRILSLFGVEDIVSDLPHLRVDTSLDQRILANAQTRITPLLMTDYRNFWCASRATCRDQIGAICTGNC